MTTRTPFFKLSSGRIPVAIAAVDFATSSWPGGVACEPRMPQAFQAGQRIPSFMLSSADWDEQVSAGNLVVVDAGAGDPPFVVDSSGRAVIATVTGAPIELTTLEGAVRRLVVGASVPSDQFRRDEWLLNEGRGRLVRTGTFTSDVAYVDSTGLCPTATLLRPWAFAANSGHGHEVRPTPGSIVSAATVTREAWVRALATQAPQVLSPSSLTLPCPCTLSSGLALQATLTRPKATADAGLALYGPRVLSPWGEVYELFADPAADPSTNATITAWSDEMDAANWAAFLAAGAVLT